MKTLMPGRGLSGPLPAGFKIIPDLTLEEELRATMQVIDADNIPVGASGGILEDGTLLSGSIDADRLTSFVNGTGMSLWNNQVDTVTIGLFRPATNRQMGSAIAVIKSRPQNEIFTVKVSLFDGITGNVIKETEFDTVTPMDVRRTIRGAKNNPPEEWTSIIEADGMTKRWLEEDIARNKDNIAREEGLIPGKKSRVVLADGSTGEVVHVSNNNLDVQLDHMPDNTPHTFDAKEVRFEEQGWDDVTTDVSRVTFDEGQRRPSPPASTADIKFPKKMTDHPDNYLDEDIFINRSGKLDVEMYMMDELDTPNGRWLSVDISRLGGISDKPTGFRELIKNLNKIMELNPGLDGVESLLMNDKLGRMLERMGATMEVGSKPGRPFIGQITLKRGLISRLAGAGEESIFRVLSGGADESTDIGRRIIGGEVFPAPEKITDLKFPKSMGDKVSEHYGTFTDDTGDIIINGYLSPDDTRLIRVDIERSPTSADGVRGFRDLVKKIDELMELNPALNGVESNVVNEDLVRLLDRSSVGGQSRAKTVEKFDIPAFDEKDVVHARKMFLNRGLISRLARSSDGSILKVLGGDADEVTNVMRGAEAQTLDDRFIIALGDKEVSFIPSTKDLNEIGFYAISHTGQPVVINGVKNANDALVKADPFLGLVVEKTSKGVAKVYIGNIVNQEQLRALTEVLESEQFSHVGIAQAAHPLSREKSTIIFNTKKLSPQTIDDVIISIENMPRDRLSTIPGTTDNIITDEATNIARGGDDIFEAAGKTEDTDIILNNLEDKLPSGFKVPKSLDAARKQLDTVTKRLEGDLSDNMADILGDYQNELEDAIGEIESLSDEATSIAAPIADTPETIKSMNSALYRHNLDIPVDEMKHTDAPFIRARGSDELIRIDPKRGAITPNKPSIKTWTQPSRFEESRIDAEDIVELVASDGETVIWKRTEDQFQLAGKGQETTKMPEDYSKPEWDRELAGEDALVSPLNDEAKKILEVFEAEGRTATPDELKNIRRVIGENGIDTFERSDEDIFNALIEKKNLLDEAPSGADAKRIEDAQKLYDDLTAEVEGKLRQAGTPAHIISDLTQQQAKAWNALEEAKDIPVSKEAALTAKERKNTLANLHKARMSHLPSVK
jgi:hypothetical protein